MYLSKKKLKELNLIEVVHDILSENSHPCIDSPPDMWNDDEKEIFDIACEVQDKIKKEVIEILTHKPIK